MSEKEITQLTYEEAIKELEQIVAMLEEDELTLDKSLELYKRGQSLLTHCSDILNKAQLQVNQLPEVE
ncbi:MAG TPA: exodeoxyribonuclease VII small subunit [Anaerolineales bacterium]|nr:exodeoxyribonuclease VII small subunit [Anaerolineales bacterium]